MCHGKLKLGLHGLRQSQLFVVLTHPVLSLVARLILLGLHHRWRVIVFTSHFLPYEVVQPPLAIASLWGRAQRPFALRGLPSARPDAPALSPSSDAHAAFAFSPSLSRSGWQVTLNLASRAVDGKCLGIVKIVASLSPRRNRRRRLAVQSGRSSAQEPGLGLGLRAENERRRWDDRTKDGDRQSES